MPIQTQATVVEATRLNEYAHSFTLEVGEDLAGLIGPGRFIHVKCGEGLLLRRPISICDWQGDCLRMVFEVRGEGTRWLSQRKAGDKLDVLGPLGHGFDVSGAKLLLVGGGIGVPPLLGCAKAAAGQGNEVHAVLGFRDEAHRMLTGDFEACGACVGVISDDGSTGRKGFVTDLVEELLDKENGFTSILACGPKPMLKGVAALAARHNIPCQVSMEERMGCGVGACLVCACDMADGRRRHVCKDGPVFNAQEVDWND